LFRLRVSACDGGGTHLFEMSREGAGKLSTHRGREYEPFLAWGCVGGKPSQSYYYASGLPVDHYTLGETCRTEGSVERTGLLYYHRAFSMLKNPNNGIIAVRLEVVGPVMQYSGASLAKQITPLWAIDASFACHQFAVWCAEDYCSRLKSVHAIAQMQEAICLKRQTLDVLRERGVRLWGEVLDFDTEEGKRQWKLLKRNKVLDALCNPNPRACAVNTFQHVYESYTRETFHDFTRCAYDEFERLLEQGKERGN
jgi:hypothetical protein